PVTHVMQPGLPAYADRVVPDQTFRHSPSRRWLRGSSSRIGRKFCVDRPLRGVLHHVIGVALGCSEVTLQNRGIPVFFVTQSPVAVLDALDGEMVVCRFDGFFHTELCRLVTGDTGFKLKQVRVIDELVYIWRQLIREDGLRRRDGMQNGASPDIDASEVHRYLVHPVLRGSPYTQEACADSTSA